MGAIKSSTMVKSTIEMASRIFKLRKDVGSDQFVMTKKTVTDNCEQFSKDWVNRKVEKFVGTLIQDKPPNVSVMEDGYDQTPLVLGKVPVGKLVKKRDQQALEVELLSRGVPVVQLWTLNIKELQKHEGNTKHFKPVSNAEFNVHEHLELNSGRFNA